MLAKQQIPCQNRALGNEHMLMDPKTALGLPRRPAVIRAIANGVVVVVVAAVVVPVSLRSSHLPMDAEVVLPLPRPRGAAISICAAMATDVVVVVVVVVLVVFPPLPTIYLVSGRYANGKRAHHRTMVLAGRPPRMASRRWVTDGRVNANASHS